MADMTRDGYAPKSVQEKATKVVETIVDALEDSMRDIG